MSGNASEATVRRILVVEDDPDLFNLLKYNLEKKGFEFLGFQTGKGVPEFCRKARPDLAVLDIMLPGLDGLDICKEIRKQPELAAMPIIFLTARTSEADRVIGLEIGANDYIVKPFYVRELIARIKVQLRGPVVPPRLLQAGGIQLDRDSLQVRLNGSLVSLTATEFRLLEFLMTRPGVVFSRETLLDAVWGRDSAPTDRAVDVYVLRLRHKLENDSSDRIFLHAVRGFGYKFEPASR